MIPMTLDVAAGALVLPGGARIGRGTTLDGARALLRAAGVEPADEAAPMGAALRAPAQIAGRALEIELRFPSSDLSDVRLTASGSTDAHEIARTHLHMAWLRALLGPPGYENARGAMYAYAWGWIHATLGQIFLTYPGHRAPVPLPGAGVSDGATFRCCGCGHVMDLGYGSGVLEASRSRGGAPCEACGAIAWVQVGSMTEFYRYSQRPDVCEVGSHPAEQVRAYTLLPRDDAPRGEGIRLTSLLVKACPAHARELSEGFLGFYLPG